MTTINKEQEVKNVRVEADLSGLNKVETSISVDKTNVEVESWMEKIEKRFARIPKGVPGPQDDQVVIQQDDSNQPAIKLPITQTGWNNGKKASVENSIAWLWLWVKRRIAQLTKLGRRVILSELPEVEEKK